MKSFITLFAFLTFFAANAENRFYNGYIVKNSGDTVTGFLEYKNWDVNPEKIRFSTDSSVNQPKIYTISDIKAFGFNEGEQYERYKLSVSMDTTNLQYLRTGRSLKKEEREVFLLLFRINKYVNFYAYRDYLKIRFFIKEDSDEAPRELIYRIYYQSSSGDNVIKEETYKKQIQDLFSNYSSTNRNIVREINRLQYTQKSLLAVLSYLGDIKLQRAAPSAQKKIELKKTKTFFFLMAGVNSYRYIGQFELTYNNTQGTKVSPVFTFGIDILPLKFKKTFFFRGEISSSFTSYLGTPAYNGYYFTEAGFKTSAFSVAPLLGINIFRSKNIRVFAAGIVGYNIASVNYQHKGWQSTLFKQRKTEQWFDTNFLLGAVIKDKIQLTVMNKNSLEANYDPSQTFFRVGIVL